MAEIRIEKKKPVWPWILGVLLLLVALYFFFFSNGGSENKDVPAPAAEEQLETPASATEEGDALSLFINHVETEEGRMGLDHEYTHRALTLLAEALTAVSEKQEFDNSAEISALKEKGDQIQKDPMSLKHANTIKEAFTIASRAFANLQQEHFPDMKDEVDKLKEQGEKLDPATPTLDQRNAVKGYFDQAAAILEDMYQS